MGTLTRHVPAGDAWRPIGPHLALAVEQMAHAAGAARLFPPVMLPMAVADVLDVPEPSARLLAAACASLWRGADLLDDLADGDGVEPWRSTSPALVTLVATNLLSNVPHLLVDDLVVAGVDPAVGCALHRAIARTLLEMSAGQYRDVDRTVASHASYLDVVRGKTGAEMAFFAEAPALLAGRPVAEVDGWRRFGSHLGVMAQVFSDVADLVRPDGGTDLAAGRLTRAALVALDGLDPGEGDPLRVDLAAASVDPAALERVRQRLLQPEVWRRSLVLVELMRHRAAAALPVPLSAVPAGHPLRTLLSSWAVVPVTLPGETSHVQEAPPS